MASCKSFLLTRMKVLKTAPEIRQILSSFNRDTVIGFVPTMGTLHAGHLSLAKHARAHCDVLVASIFVNRAQFGPNEDFDRYPKQLEKDCDMLASAGVDIVYTPSESSLYPEGTDKATRIYVPDLGKILCGVTRPQFFEGICMVVLRLLNIVQPQILFVGEKDFQQFVILKKMTRDLLLKTSVVALPIVRDKEGLALSSRNAYLSQNEQRQAAEIYQGLQISKRAFSDGEIELEVLVDLVRDHLSDLSIKIDYIEIRDSNSLDLVAKPTHTSRLFFAGTLSGTRLIDNLSL
jgi:pantoate--beta-alanine ligase